MSAYTEGSDQFNRLAWFAQQLGHGRTDFSLVDECMQIFKVSEKQARKDLKTVYSRCFQIELENCAEHKVKFMELGYRLLRDAHENMQFGAAVQQFKTLAQMAGLLDQKINLGTVVEAQQSTNVRDRIAELRSDPKIRARAQRMGLDIPESDPTLPED